MINPSIFSFILHMQLHRVKGMLNDDKNLLDTFFIDNIDESVYKSKRKENVNCVIWFLWQHESRPKMKAMMLNPIENKRQIANRRFNGI